MDARRDFLPCVFELSPYFVAIKLKIAGRYGDAMWYQNVIATVEIKLRM